MQNGDRFVIILFRNQGGGLVPLNLYYFEGSDWLLALGTLPTHCTFFSYNVG